MIIIQMGFGLSIKRGHMFGKKDSDMKLISIKLPFLHILILNKKASSHWLESGRSAFNDPNWFIENHHAVRQAKRRATIRKHEFWCAAHKEVGAYYIKEISGLRQDNYGKAVKIREMRRDIEAYKKLVEGKNE